MQQLQNKGAEISYNDPYVPVFPKMRRYSFDLESVSLTEESIAAFDCVVITTNHDCYDFGWIAEHAALVVDTRGALRDSNGKVFQA
jgi:UDP-N-acetyl-D-glucosamine dehydrogenase